MQYLSEEWITAAGEAMAAAWAGRGAEATDGDEALTTVTYEVTGAPQGKVVYHVWFGPDGAGMAPGRPEGEPDAEMTLDYDTAVEIARGETPAQVAFMQGRLKLGGSVTLLLERAGALAAVGDGLAAVRDRTEF